MNNLIKVQVNEQGKQIVSAKELYLGLGMDKSNWAKWYKKNILKNSFFLEKVDWIGVRTEYEGNETMDFAITLEFAKHIAMMAKTKKSHEYRNYFIECEKQLKEGQTQKELTAREKLELHYQFSEENAKRIDSIEERLDNQTLSTAQTKKLKKLANSIAVPLVGGKGSNAYDTMIRKVYSDMYRQLFRELGVQASDEIKVKDFDFALEVMGNYKIATALKNDISILNNQSKLDV